MFCFRHILMIYHFSLDSRGKDVGMKWSAKALSIRSELGFGELAIDGQGEVGMLRPCSM